MDIFSMLQNALIVDAETNEVIGGAVGFEVDDAQMTIKIVLLDEFIEVDPDGGEEKPVEYIRPLNLMTGGKANG